MGARKTFARIMSKMIGNTFAVRAAVACIRIFVSWPASIVQCILVQDIVMSSQSWWQWGCGAEG